MNSAEREALQLKRLCLAAPVLLGVTAVARFGSLRPDANPLVVGGRWLAGLVLMSLLLVGAVMLARVWLRSRPMTVPPWLAFSCLGLMGLFNFIAGFGDSNVVGQIAAVVILPMMTGMVWGMFVLLRRQKRRIRSGALHHNNH